MKLKGYSKVLSVMAVSALLLAACNDDTEKAGTKSPDKNKPTKEVKQEDAAAFPRTTSNTKEPLEDGHVNYGLVSDTPFEGILNYSFYEGDPDWQVLRIFDEGLLATDEDYVFNQEGAATYELKNDNKTMELTIRDGVKWHDGKPVTGEDLEYAYLVIGNKDYTGVRYDTQMAMIEGMEEYHAGKADKISGIKVEGNKISFTFKEANPSVLTGLWTYPLHKEYLKDVKIKDLVESDKIRKEPIGFGPYKVKKIVQGEAVEYERFDDYWKGKPKAAGVTLKVVNNSIAVKSLQNGDLDLATVNADQMDSAKALGNIEILGNLELAYTYIGFKLGRYDAEKEVSVMDRPKMQNKQLRQAMAYAIDNNIVAEKFYKGLRFAATSVIPTAFPKYHNTEMEGYKFDPEKAKSLLDEAKYVDKDGDGLREDPNGEKFTINFASMTGTDIAEPLSQLYIQQWKDVGLDVQLVDGKLAEFNSFYEMLQTDSEKVDIYQAAWGTGSDPDPSGIWAKGASYNYTRWVNDKNDELLKQGISAKAFDEDYRKDIYNQWQELVHEEVPVIPTLFRYEFEAANKRVTGFDLKFFDWSEIGVTEAEPVK
ncbi:oligopeptide ABC transporter substrate-binding protein [Peribacillus psychrosaccharolyticus]|nr:oligopeptide ABC transporter substrate-binding protein [Peribacillus psychrosaccharolyticus]MEC2057508.1 oligopeptide ABC transporter substrate-binding protein [Peribacillus psychrosaccharolyticus]MED3745963.1 oligopeptide ABC transporter substrate-binding protein [Peribacillus psychrosaccharolyticus]